MGAPMPLYQPRGWIAFCKERLAYFVSRVMEFIEGRAQLRERSADSLLQH